MASRRASPGSTPPRRFRRPSRAQEQLLREQYGIERLALVGGGSMGAQQTREWAVRWQRGDVARNTGGDLAAALRRITATTYVLPIEQDMFFPPKDCIPEQELTPGSELRMLDSVAGHFGSFGFEQSYLDELDGHLRDLLAVER